MVQIRHVAIIMDGNGRWAQARGMPRSYGHVKGVGAVRSAIEACHENNIKELTVFALSSENMNRPIKEIKFLLKLFSEQMNAQIEKLASNNVRIRCLGDFSSLPDEVVATANMAEQRTQTNGGLLLTVCFNYGGRWHIAKVANQLASQGAIDEQAFEKAMLKDLSEPDLLIRTGGDRRISNFLLYHLAYSELYFTDVLWPDFNKDEFKKALTDFSERKRRFGLLKNHQSESITSEND
jgi:undecaprenyl diphosphate synthase